MKIAVTGLHLGNISTEFVGRGHSILECDVTKPDEIRRELDRIQPDVIVHTAAMTSVDECQAKPSDAMDVNVKGTANIIKEIDNTNTIFIFMSSDHVFKGHLYGTTGYTERHEPSPVNVYGMTKLGAEFVVSTALCPHLVVRTSKLFTKDRVQSELLDIKAKNGEVEYTNIIKRTFMYVPHFVNALLYVINNFDKFKDEEVLHVSGDGRISYYGFWYTACTIFYGPEIANKLYKRDRELKDCTPRPLRGGLNSSNAIHSGVPITSYYNGLTEIKALQNDK